MNTTLVAPLACTANTEQWVQVPPSSMTRIFDITGIGLVDIARPVVTATLWNEKAMHNDVAVVGTVGFLSNQLIPTAIAAWSAGQGNNCAVLTMKPVGLDTNEPARHFYLDGEGKSLMGRDGSDAHYILQDVSFNHLKQLWQEMVDKQGKTEKPVWA